MHIVFLLLDIHIIGGVERVTVNLANNLAKNGHKVTIISLSRIKPLSIFTIDNRVEIKYLNFNFENIFNIPQKIAAVFKVSHHLQKYTDQTVILGIGIYPSLILALISKRDNIKTIGCQHNSFDFHKHVWSLLRKILFHRLNALVSLTEQDLPKLKKLNQNSYVIPNSVSFFPKRPAKLDSKIILAIGRIDYNKGFDLLLDVFENITLSHPDWRLRIIGDGPLKGKIVSRIESSCLKDRVEILAPTNKIIEQYLQSSIYLMTSRTEALPMVLLEAQACGLPIISFNCKTGPSDIISNGKDGYLIDCFNTDLMTEKVALLCSDSEKRKDFGANGRESIKKFFPEEIINKWEMLFNKLSQ